MSSLQGPYSGSVSRQVDQLPPCRSVNTNAPLVKICCISSLPWLVLCSNTKRFIGCKPIQFFKESIWQHISKTMKLLILYPISGNVFKYKGRISYRTTDVYECIIHEDKTPQVMSSPTQRNKFVIILFFSGNYVLLKLKLHNPT